MKQNRTKIVLLTLALSLAGCAPAYLSRPGGPGTVLVRVALRHGLPSAVIAGVDSLRITDAAHRALLAPGETWTVTAPGGALAAATSRGTVVAVEGPLALWSPAGVRVDGTVVAAPLELRPEAGGVLVVAELPLEDYVAGVVAAELGMVKPEEIEAAKAQAVAARSYAHCKIGSKPGAGYDLEASVSEQAFDPGRAANPTVQKAVRQTAGQVLACGGTVVAANYHSTCGGRTALASEAWTADDSHFPYIKSVKDGYCSISPRFAWQDSLFSTDIALRLLDSGVAVTDLAVTRRGPSGRVVALRVSAQACDTTLSKDRIRFSLAERALPSTLFDLDCRRDGRGFVETAVLRGTGYGHGVGMCQWGAIGMARKGKSYVRILKHYYRDVRIEKLY